MRPPGFLLLGDVAHYLGMPRAHRDMATRRYLERAGLHPALQLTTRGRPMLWRWEDVAPLRHQQKVAA